MNILSRAKQLFQRFNPAFCILGGALALYLGRVAALYVLARAFAGAGLSSETYASAPAWLRFLATNADALANITGLILGCCAVVLLRKGANPLGRIRRKDWLTLPLGFGYGVGALSLLRLLDEVRFLPGSFTVDWLGCLLWLCLSVFTALCLRGAFDANDNRWVAYAASMLLQALFAWYLHGQFDALLTVNALLFGWLSTRFYRRKKSLWPEILLLYGFALGQRVICGYPKNTVYYVSANLLNGGNAGLFGSVLTTVPLALIVAFVLLRRFLHSRRKVEKTQP